MVRRVYKGGFDMARLGGHKPITSVARLHMASVNKLFVATAVMQLIGEGRSISMRRSHVI